MYQIIKRWLAKLLRVKSPSIEFVKMINKDSEEERDE